MGWTCRRGLAAGLDRRVGRSIQCPTRPPTTCCLISISGIDVSDVARHRREDEGFQLLYVCTGNICRSPFAEILTRHLLADRLGGGAASAFDVSSAGVQAVVGAPMHPMTRRELAPRGLPAAAAERFVARQVQPPMIAAAHLVLCVDPDHRSAVIGQESAALATAFGLREFALPSRWTGGR